MNEFKILDDEGQIIARENLYLAFFREVPFQKMVQGVAEVFEQWLNMVPQETLSWCVLSETQEEYKPFTKARLNRCRKLLTKSIAAKKNVYIDLVGPQPYGADYRFIVAGYKELEKDGYIDETNLVEMRFPTGFLQDYGEKRFTEFATTGFQTLGCDSGLATFGYSAGSDADYSKASPHIIPLAFQHPGFDLAENEFVSSIIGKKCRGARWLTMLSNELIEQIGGKNKLQGLVKQGIDIRTTENGVVLRAGTTPEIGNTNRNVAVPMLSAIAKVIEHVTFFEDNGLLPLLDHDPEKRDRWERRFWENEH
jgi:hypothetical protein